MNENNTGRGAGSVTGNRGCVRQSRTRVHEGRYPLDQVAEARDTHATRNRGVDDWVADWRKAYQRMFPG